MPTAKKIFIFSGLGVDHRAFRNIDLSTLNHVHINWIKPIEGESLPDYAKRIAKQITVSDPILVGLSFGGIMVMEVAKHFPTEKIILISSVKTRKEIPFYYKIAGAIRLHKILPITIFKTPSFFIHWLFGIKTKKDKSLLAEILKDTDPDFISWAIEKILFWKNQTIHTNAIHIHGSADKILPLKFVHADYVIKKGGHFMVVDNADEINRIIKEIV